MSINTITFIVLCAASLLSLYAAFAAERWSVSHIADHINQEQNQ